MAPSLWLRQLKQLRRLRRLRRQKVFLKTFPMYLPLPAWPGRQQNAAWKIMFKDNKWVKNVRTIKQQCGKDPNPALVGPDAFEVAEGRTHGKNLTLTVNDWTGDVKYFKEQLFKSLREHQFYEETSEIVLKESGLTVNIHDALYSPLAVLLPDLSKLLAKHEVSTQIIFYDEKDIHKLDQVSIGGIEGGRNHPTDFSELCALKTKFRSSRKSEKQTTFWRMFQSPGWVTKVVPKKDENTALGENICGWVKAQASDKDVWDPAINSVII